jgi:glycogen synthase
MSGSIILFGPLPPPFGGVSVYTQALMKHLRDANIRVWAYTGAANQEGNVKFINHRRLGTFSALITEGRGARILDATHFHFEYPNALLLLIWILLKPFVRFEWYKNVHDGSLPRRHERFSIVQRLLFRLALNSIDEFVVVSDELKNWLQQKLHVNKKVTVIPCLLPPLAGEAELGSEIETALTNYLQASKRVCCIGVFIADYGFADAANAVEAVRNETGADIQLMLLDGVFARDEDFRADVLRDRPWITVIEKVANEKIPLILKRSDVFVRAFRDESFGLSRVESIWSGTPVIATRAGETRGMRLYDFGDQEQLAAHLKAVLFGTANDDLSAWAARYREEAENNLRALRKILQLNSPDSK